MRFIAKLKKAAPKSLKALVIGGAIVASGMFGLHAYQVHAQSSYNCDANAVLWCGASSPSVVLDKYKNGDGHNTAASIQAIYNWFGISSSDIASMGTYAVEGSVSSNGNVYVGNTVVATDAVTGGRQWENGSTTEKLSDGTTFYSRPPSVSFPGGSLSAMVVMKDGVFQFAILHTCGNAVKAKAPNYTISKQVRAEGSSSYSSNVSVNSGTTVQYQITVSSTGQIPVENVTVHDKLPGDIAYTSGTLQENGSAVSSSNASKFFGSGLLISSIKNGSKDVFTFNAVAGNAAATADNCKAEQLDNTGYISAPELSGQNSTATVKTTCTPPPKVSLACNALTATPGDIDVNGNQSYTFVADASVQNATITNYTFNVDGSTSNSTSNALTHTFAPGSHSVSVTVNASANGKAYTATSSDCQKTFTVQPAGKLVCSNLTLTPGTAETNGDTPYTLTATAAATNATIASYAFDFGDGQNHTVNTASTSATTDHTYAPGNYNATVLVTGTAANGQSVSASCAGQITVQPPTPVYACDGLTAVPAGDADVNGSVAYKLVATAIATNATISGYTFDFGDGTQAEAVASSSTSQSTIHTYAPGTYTAKATVNITLSDGTTKTITADACQAQVTVQQPTCTAPNGKTYPKGSEECAPTCTAPNGQTYPAGSQNCVACKYNNKLAASSSQCTPPPTCTSPTTGKSYPMGSSECQTPTTLVNTGPGSMLGMFLGASLAGFIGYRFFLSRRLARES